DLKAGTQTFSQISLSLQMACLATVIVCDMLIIWKVYKIRKARITNVQTSIHPSAFSGAASNNTITPNASMNTSQPNRFERRIAIAFLLLSLSFLIPTIVFNSRSVFQKFLLYNLVTKFSNLLEYSKWMVYTISLPSIRKQFSKAFCRL
ncbi:hypothetical protein PMAYCL1PPCAC_09782, partial [Pristionchus mayeri]